jgi:ribonucleoside-diphosphate reductase alpha chain
MVSFEEAIQQSTEYFEGNGLAANVFVTKYALRDEARNLLEAVPEQMHRRLAKEFARIESKYKNPLSEEKIFSYLDKFKYVIPQGSPMAGIGNKYQLMSLSNCFVIPPPNDSMSGITYTIAEEKEIMKRRGGVGFDISTIRPKGMPTSNAAGTTDGIAVFMDDFSDACRRTAQNGRRGALMLTISVHHPEIQTFIDIKKDKSRVTGANISIRLSDEFMEAVRDGKEVELRFPVDSPNPKIRKMVDAQALWTEIVTAAHASAEPGLLFWDPIMKYCPANNYPEYKTSATNPCGEITLSPYDSCRLLLINTLSFVQNPYTKNALVDWAKFGEVVRDSQRLMDDIVDLELESVDRIIAKIKSDPEPDHIKMAEMRLWNNIREACERGRRTGLGVTAVGDFVAALGMRYGSEDSIRVVEYLYRMLALNSYASSIQLAKERGAFPAFNHDLEKNDPFLQRIWDAEPSLYEEYKKYGRRNIANNTTAPAGSTSILAKAVIGFGTTSGIENAVFAAFYLRRKKINPSDTNARVDFTDAQGDKWTEYKVYNQGFAAWKEINQKTDDDVEQSPYWKSTIADVDWVAKVEMQGAAQKWIDHSISNTTNLPRDASVETVKAVYMKGWEVGCKGITIYRDGCRDGVILSADSKASVEDDDGFVEHHAPKRPSELECDVYHPTIQGEKWTIFVGKLGGRPYEVMGGLSRHITLPKRVRGGKTVKRNGEVNPAEYDFHYDFENPEDETIIKNIGNIFENPTHAAFTRTISLALRHGAPVQYVVEQLLKGAEKESDLFSFSKVMSRVLKNYIKDGTKASQKKCPDCGSTNLSYQQGCVTCLDCGSSKCG